MKATGVVLAGSRPGHDEFAEQFGTDMKALISIAGEPMVRRPVRALLASANIGRILVLSQAPERISRVIPTNPRIEIRESRRTVAETMLTLLDDKMLEWPLLVTTADHALLDTATVDEFIQKALGTDIAIGLVERTNLLERFPRAERTWLKFRGGAYTGANLFLLKSAAVRPAIELWRSVEQDRKKAWRLISLLGPAVLLAVLLRLVSVDEVVAQLGRKIGLSMRVVRISNPCAGVDVDKPADHTLVEAVLAGKT